MAADEATGKLVVLPHAHTSHPLPTNPHRSRPAPNQRFGATLFCSRRSTAIHSDRRQSNCVGKSAGQHLLLGGQLNCYPFPGYRLWRARLSQGRARGLEPMEFLEQWRNQPQHPRAGSIPDDTEASVADSLHDLEQIAQQPDN